MKTVNFISILFLISHISFAQKLPKVLEIRTLTEPIPAGSGGMEVDRLGNIYMSDFGELLNTAGGTKVYKISPEGEVEVFADQLNGASGNDIGPDGFFYQSNVSGNKISVIDHSGKVSDFTSNGIYSPVGLVKTPTDLFVANCGNGTIQRISNEGESSVFAKSELLKCPNGLEMDESGNLYVANFANGDVIKIDHSGNASVLASLPGNNNGHLVYHNKMLYVIARKANQLWAVDLEGNKTLLAGSGERGNKDGSAEESSFHFPNDLAFSPDFSKLYINDILGDAEDHRQLSPVIIRVLDLKW